jgi:RNA polymerase sigma-70 factor (ECF subfamily)
MVGIPSGRLDGAPLTAQDAAAPEAVDDPPPFERVYEAHADAVYRFCLSQVGRAGLAEEITADTFVAAFAAYDRYRPELGGVRPWLFRIARNTAIDHFRRTRRARELVARLAGRDRDRAEPVEALVELREDTRRAAAAVSRLSGRDRQLVGLRVASGLSFAEIAAVVGTAEGAARTATFRALRRLRGWMEE